MARALHTVMIAVTLVLTTPCAEVAWAMQRAPRDTLTVEEILQELLDALDPESEAMEDLVEDVREFAARPLDLNTASASELTLIPTLDGVVAARLLEARTEHGPFALVEEAFELAAIDPEARLRIRPFVTVVPHDPTTRRPPRPVLHDLEVDLIQRLTRRLDLGRGYSNDTTRTTYLGGPERLYTRVRARAGGHLSANLTLDKRPGEPFTWDPATRSYGFDHVATNLAVHQVGPLETLVLGDYTLLLGQGVALWRPTAFGKGRETVRPVVRQGVRIAPYGSTQRNRFFRGAAGTLRLGSGLRITAFASKKAIDALLEELPDEGRVVTSFPSGDLHRTASERERKGAARARVFGGALTYASGQSMIGVTAHHTRFEVPVQPEPVPYRAYDFSGRAAHIASVFGNVTLNGIQLFGEGARDHRGVLGGTVGTLARLGEHGSAVVSVRHYPKDFVSLHGSAFREGSGAPANETGIYTGLSLRTGPSWRVAGYFDQFHFPWVRFTTPRPARGHDALFLLEYRVGPGASVYLQGRTKTHETGTLVEQSGSGVPMEAVATETRQSARIHASYRAHRRLRFQTRLETTRFIDAATTTHHGVLLFQDVRWMSHSSFQLDARLTFFDAEHFGARLFAYENDLLYTFSVPMLSGRGQRAYLLARWTPVPALTLELKVSETHLEDVDTMGSGLDEVDGDRLREVRAQVRWRF